MSNPHDLKMISGTRHRVPTIEDLSNNQAIFKLGEQPHAQEGILFLHGLSSGPAIYHAMVASFIKSGYSISVPRLKGHGTTLNELQACVWRDWLQDAERAYLQLQEHCQKISIVGLSLGGALAILLGAKFPKTRKLFLLAPAIYPIKRAALAQKLFLLQILPLLGIQTIPAIAGNVLKPERYELAYEKLPIKTLIECLACMDAARAALPLVTIDTIVFQGLQDKLVPPMRAQNILSLLSSRHKQLIQYETSAHLLPIDHDADDVVLKIQQALS